METGQRKRQGRKQRMAVRAAPPVVNVAPPGQIGGQYRPMSESDLSAIYETALRLLAELGMGEVPDRLARDLTKAGAVEVMPGRLGFPRSMVERAIQASPKRVTLHGFDPARSFEAGGDAVHFGTGGAAVQTLDMETGLYRPSTLADLHDFTRLQDTLTNVSWFTRCCVATDVADPFDLDINTAYALLRNTTKPVATSFATAASVPPIVEMFDMGLGGTGAFAQRPICKAHISPVISPMRYGADAVEVLYACIEHNFPINNITGAQSGATAPATLAGILAQTLAETLASLVMVYAIKPDHPMIFSNWPFVVDLRTGAFAGGGGEVAVLNAASAQISNWLGLCSGVAASMTDAKAVDAQYGAEKAMTSVAAALAGGNLIYESSGMTASLLGASFEGFVLDDEMHAATYRMMRGIEVDQETLGFEAIVETVLGVGHFLGGDHTFRAMERDYFYPALADRENPRQWQETGALNSWDRAKVKAQEILATHWPDHLDGVDQDIRKRFDIVHPAR